MCQQFSNVLTTLSSPGAPWAPLSRAAPPFLMCVEGRVLAQESEDTGLSFYLTTPQQCDLEHVIVTLWICCHL